MDLCMACTECPLYFVSESGRCHSVCLLCNKGAVLRDSDAVYVLVL
jgi:hypothetical protein